MARARGNCCGSAAAQFLQPRENGDGVAGLRVGVLEIEGKAAVLSLQSGKRRRCDGGEFSGRVQGFEWPYATGCKDGCRGTCHGRESLFEPATDGGFQEKCRDLWASRTA